MKKIVTFICALTLALSAYAATPLSSGTYLTTGGKFYIEWFEKWEDFTSDMSYVEVTVNGTQVTIVGLAYWFEEGSVTGTLSGNTITFTSGQKVGEDENGPEYMVGSPDMSSICDIVFEYNPDNQTLTATTPYIFESADQNNSYPYCYWDHAVFTKQGAGTGIDHTAASTKSVKRIVDGQLVISRDGKAFNVLGSELRK